MRAKTIRNNMSKKAIAALMAVMIMSAPVTNVTFASEVPEAPEKPVATSHVDNDKIEAYNKKVDEYNEAAKAHNDSVDKEYEAAVAETEKKNAEIDQYNAAEQQRVKDAEERNVKAQQAADEENKKIAEENANEAARVKEHNDNEDAKAKASAEARKAAEDYNEEAKAHNEAVAKYAADKVKYDEDYAKYQKDLEMEKKILAAGYASVQQYNDRINKAYNDPARESVEKNASAKKVSAKDTYSVEEAAVKSGEKVKVHIAHIFEGTDISYVEDFEIDRNDVITINSIAALGHATQPGYASLYYNTDEAHSMGYWVPWDELQYNARYVDSTWNCGTSYKISYKDGKNHAGDEEVISMVYNYTWIAQRVYKTYDVPVAPTAPENPGEARELVDVPELYTPEYKTYEEKQFVEAELEKIIEADLLENVANPVKKAYISLIDYMTVFDIPEASEVAKVIKNEAPAANVAIANDATPLAAANAEVVSDNAVPMTIMDSETPQAPAGAWALINLLSALATALLSLIMMIGFFRARREENEETGELEERNRKGVRRLASVIPAIGAIAAFLLTENMANPMILTDRWTVMMLVILAIQTGVALLVAKKDNNEEELERA